MDKMLNYIISRIPVSLFLIVVAYDLIFSNIHVDQAVYEKIYFFASEIIGSSLTTSLFMLFACYRYKLCWYNKVSVYGFLALNSVNLLAISSVPIFDYYYSTISHVIMIPTAILALILLIKRK